MKKTQILLITLTTTLSTVLSAQNKITADFTSVVTDSTKVALKSAEGDDRNVMLNAANNTGPREVNIGLPAGTGGTTILENGLPVVYIYWPEMPTKAWRSDAMLNKVKLLDLGQTAINVGDVGFSLSSFDNLGTDKFMGKANLSGNHFGLIKTTVNISGPIKNGWKYSVGGYLNLDPGTYKAATYPTFFADDTKLFKAAITKDYSYTNGKGSISVLYKYMNTKTAIGNSQSHPFIYGENGEVTELDGFKIGGNSYLEQSAKMWFLDAKSGKMVERDVRNDYNTESSTFDVIGKNTFKNNYDLNYIVRLHSANSGTYLNSVSNIVQRNSDQYAYHDTGEKYNGKYVQTNLILGAPSVPILSVTSLVELKKKFGKHDLKVGLNQWNYTIDGFTTESVNHLQSVEANPRKLALAGTTDQYGNVVNQYNKILEFHNGSENETAMFITDQWEVSNKLSLNLGARFAYQNIRGSYQDKNLGFSTVNGPKTDIRDNWFKKAFMLSAVYKMTNKFGLLGEANYNEQTGHLVTYTAGNDPNIKTSKIPEAGFGVYYNHPLFNVVSKGTYIQRNQYRANSRFTNPESGFVTSTPVQYDIETMGWTTDIVSNPFKNFNIHFLVTLQSPKYSKYEGTSEFSDGSTINFDFSDKIVTGVSKVLLEIDPSYTIKDLKLWASARYFSKTYANLANTLYFAPRWETFAGANYKLNKKIDFDFTIVNLLNQRGAKGTISGTDLYTQEQANERIGMAMAGSYIRPFTVEFGVNFKF